MNVDALINWFESRRGELTYSMTGSRNGSDGTADCSGSVAEALRCAGVNINGLPSTVTLGGQLASCGFYRVSKNTDWDGKRGDVILMSWGADMSQSGGAGGHVGVLEDADTFISVDYWTNGQAGTAVSSHSWEDYYRVTHPQYVEVWRYAGGDNNPATSNTNNAPQQQAGNGGNNGEPEKAYYLANDVAFVNGIYQIKCDFLAPVGFDYTDNGIPVCAVNWVDENGRDVTDGRDADFKAGMYFSFSGDENKILDTGQGGYYGGWYWRKFDFGQLGGTVWLSVRDKDDLINYYK